MKKLIPLLFLAAGCSGPMEIPKETSPEQILQATQPEPARPTNTQVHIHLDTGDRRMTAYQILLHFDPSIARIASIERCDHRTFPGDPEFDPKSFRRGLTRILASRTGGAKAGELHLLTIRFEKAGAGTTPIDVAVEALYDDASPPKKFHAVPSVWPRNITFE